MTMHVYRPLASADDTTSNPTQLPANTVIAALNGWMMGIRLPAVWIPRGATIASVVVRGYNENNKYDSPGQTTWYCEATDNSAQFTAAAGNLDNRTRTAASGAFWKGTDLGANQWLTSGNMSPIVQEVINRPGWRPGNALSFIVTGNGGEGLQIRSYDNTTSPGVGAWAPQVFIDWSPPPVLHRRRRR